MGFFGRLDSSTKASNNYALHVFTPLLKLAISRRPMISSKNGFHGGSREALQQFWPKKFGSSWDGWKKTKQKIFPSTHTLQKVGEKSFNKTYGQITIQFTFCEFLLVTLIVFLFFRCWTLHLKWDCFLCEKSWGDYLRDRTFDNMSTRSVNLVKHPLKTTRDVKTETKHTSPFCSREPKKK